MAASGIVAWSLRLLVVAAVTGGLGVGVYVLAQDGDGAEPQAVVVATGTPTSVIATDTPATPPPTDATATLAPPTAPPAMAIPPIPTPDTRVAIRDLPTLDQIQLGPDDKYFIADRGDGCTWVEVFRGKITFQGEEILQVTLQTDCPVDVTYAFWPEKGEVNLQVE